MNPSFNMATILIFADIAHGALFTIMSLKSTTGEIPHGAIVLTYNEAVNYQWDQIRSWPERWDVWPFRYGIPALAMVAGYSGLFINRHYRIKLKLRSYGIGSTQLAMGLSPVLFAGFPHFLFVTESLLAYKDRCSLCLQTRAALIQLGASIAYPVIMSPMANFMFATRHGTYALPYWQDYKGTIKLWLNMNKSLLRKLKYVIPFQIIFAWFITYMEAKSLYTVRSKIEKQESEYLSETSSTK